jgi:hypothetical protein
MHTQRALRRQRASRFECDHENKPPSKICVAPQRAVTTGPSTPHPPHPPATHLLPHAPHLSTRQEHPQVVGTGVCGRRTWCRGPPTGGRGPAGLERHPQLPPQRHHFGHWWSRSRRRPRWPAHRSEPTRRRTAPVAHCGRWQGCPRQCPRRPGGGTRSPPAAPRRPTTPRSRVHPHHCHWQCCHCRRRPRRHAPPVGEPDAQQRWPRAHGAKCWKQGPWRVVSSVGPPQRLCSVLWERTCGQQAVWAFDVAGSSAITMHWHARLIGCHHTTAQGAVGGTAMTVREESPSVCWFQVVCGTVCSGLWKEAGLWPRDRHHSFKHKKWPAGHWQGPLPALCGECAVIRKCSHGARMQFKQCSRCSREQTTLERGWPGPQSRCRWGGATWAVGGVLARSPCVCQPALAQAQPRRGPWEGGTRGAPGPCGLALALAVMLRAAPGP